MTDYELPEENNIFRHIFYEFRMYIDTYKELVYLEETLKHIIIDGGFSSQLFDNQFCRNVLIESHATHLRNMLFFFSKKDTANCATAFDNITPHLGISNADDKCKKISQALSHITEERYTSNDSEKDLSFEVFQLIKEMYPVVCDKITEYVKLLSNEGTIEERFKEHLSCYQPKIEKFKRDYNHIIGIFVTEESES